MATIKQKIRAKVNEVNVEIKDIIEEDGNKPIREVTLSQVYQGMRAVSYTRLDVYKRQTKGQPGLGGF